MPLPDRLVDPRERPLAGRPDGVEPLPFAAALGRRLPEARAHEAALLEAIERRVQRARRDDAVGTFLNLPTDRDAVHVRTQPHEGKENQLLEIANRVRHEVVLEDVVGIRDPGSVVHESREPTLGVARGLQAPRLFRIPDYGSRHASATTL